MLIKPNGFSLIELMVTLTIVGTALAFGLPSFSAWIQSNHIRTAAESIQNGLQLTRAEAVRRNTSVQLVLSSLAGGGTSSDWTITCSTPSSTCPGAGQSPTEIQKRMGSEGSAKAAVASAQSTIIFNGMGRMTTPTADLTLNVTNPTGGTCAAANGRMRCLNVVVSTGGHVRLCDPAFASGSNPRAC